MFQYCISVLLFIQHQMHILYWRYPPYLSERMPDYYIRSNADAEATVEKLWNDPELKAHQTGRGYSKLKLDARDFKKAVILSSKGTIQLSCDWRSLKPIFALLKSKLVTKEGQKLWLFPEKSLARLSFHYPSLTMSVQGLFLDIVLAWVLTISILVTAYYFLFPEFFMHWTFILVFVGISLIIWYPAIRFKTLR